MNKFKVGLGAMLAAAFGFAYLYIIAVGVDSASEYQAVLATGAPSGFVLWIWMLSDFFQRQDLRFRVWWGWALLLLNMGAAVVYFASVYAPREYRRQ